MYRQAAADYSYPPSGGSQFNPHPQPNQNQGGGVGQPGAGAGGVGRQWSQQGQMQQPGWNQNQMHGQQQQQQHAPMQQQQGGQGQGQQNGASTADAQSQAASGGAGQEMNLASVLHYLQSEWRRWERDRNEWEIERAEMRARIALLEGQRRSAENLKVDLLRRVKMLEYALRQERTKSVNSGKTSTLAPSRLAILQDEEKGKDDKDTASEGSDESAQDRKPNGASAMSRISSLNSRPVSGPAGPVGESAWKAVGAVPPKDPKARARSREYLKQCLQEITYLTSPGALNPLPAKAPITIERPASPAPSIGTSVSGIASTNPNAQGHGQGQTQGHGQGGMTELPDRPRKALPARTIAAPSSSSPIEQGQTNEGTGQGQVQNAAGQGAPATGTSTAQDDNSAPRQPLQPTNQGPMRIMKRPDIAPKANGSPLKKQTPLVDPQQTPIPTSAALPAAAGETTQAQASAPASAVETLRKDARQAPASPARRSMPLPMDDEPLDGPGSVSDEQGKDAGGRPDEAAESAAINDQAKGSQGEKEEEKSIHVTGADIATTTDEKAAAGSHIDTSSPCAPLSSNEGEGEDQGSDDAESDSDQSQLLTAIYRPESRAAWRDQLRVAKEQADKARDRSSSVSSASTSTSSSASTDDTPASSVGIVSDEEQLQSISLTSAELDDSDRKDSPTADKAGAEEKEKEKEKAWTSRKVLKSHLDIVRSVAFAGTTNGAAAAGAAGAAWGKTGGYAGNVVFVSAGDDCTVKVWSVAAAALRSPNSIEVEPITTYRGHTMPITTVLACSPLDQVFSASMDSTIRVWTLPPASADPYAPYDASRAVQLLEGHTDAVWDLVMLPPSPPSSAASASNGSGGRKGKARLVSIGADNTLKVWERDLSPTSSGAGQEGGKSKIKPKDAGSDTATEKTKTKANPAPTPRWTLSTSHKLEATPTCMAEFGMEQGKVVVGFQDGRVGVISVEEGEVRWYGAKNDNPVNAVLCHPTWPVILTGYEDGVVSMWEARQSARSPKHSIKAHAKAITGLAIPATAPDTLLTSSVDCLVRVWDLNKRTAVQDCQGHRQKAGEGTVGIASHGELPFVASAGADGTVRLWSDI